VGLWERAPSVLLGVFILFELIYLPAANVIKLVPLRLPESRGELDDDIQLRGKAYVEPVQRALDGLGAAMCRWGELTGQAQGWSLFAPLFGHQASLPAVHIFTASSLIHSPFRPDNPEVYVRWPEPSCRLFNYEYRLALLYWTWTQKSFDENPDEWQRAALERVRRQNRSMVAYMQWRVNKYLRSHPGSVVPTAVLLSAEMIPSPPPESPWAFRAVERFRHLAYWFPATPSPPGCLPVAASDPISMRWVWLPEDE
jgi:hypothetical protein